MYTFLADIVVVFHFLFVVFVIGGGLLVLKWPRLAYAHVPVAVWGVLIEFIGWICPLTPLENKLRRMGGGETYSGDFVERYITSIVYPDGLTRTHQLILGLIVLAINGAVYTRLFLKWRATRASSKVS